MSFLRDLVKVGSGGFVESAVAHIGLFFFAKMAGARGLMIDALANNRHFLNPPSGLGEDFAMSNFRETLRTLRAGLWVRLVPRTLFI